MYTFLKSDSELPAGTTQKRPKRETETHKTNSYYRVRTMCSQRKAIMVSNKTDQSFTSVAKLQKGKSKNAPSGTTGEQGTMHWEV